MRRFTGKAIRSKVLSRFPSGVKQDLGYNLRRVQQGMPPLCISYRPMQAIGRGVFELKEQDERTWYRVVYLAAFGFEV